MFSLSSFPPHRECVRLFLLHRIPHVWKVGICDWQCACASLKLMLAVLCDVRPYSHMADPHLVYPHI